MGSLLRIRANPGSCKNIDNLLAIFKVFLTLYIRERTKLSFVAVMNTWFLKVIFNHGMQKHLDDAIAIAKGLNTFIESGYREQ